MKRKRVLSAIICVCAVLALVVSAAAVTRYKFKSSGEEAVIKTVNRVDIEVSATRFTFDKPDSDGYLSCTATVSIKKTEPDFYGVLNSITLSGQDFGYIVYTAGKDNGSSSLPENLTLPTGDNGVYPLEWEVTFTVPFVEGQTEYNASIDFNYTTGIKTNAAQRYTASVPIVITVQE